MNENIDLTKILKDCPIGWKFYSSVYGDVEFLGVSHGCPVPLHGKDDEWYFMEDLMCKKYHIRIKTIFGEYDVSREGKLRVGAGECTLFPSKGQRDWSKFTAPWYKKEKFDPKTLMPFDRVLARIDGGNAYCWFADFVSTPTIEKYDLLPCIMSNKDANMIIPYNDETKHLVGTSEEAPEYYRYWED